MLLRRLSLGCLVLVSGCGSLLGPSTERSVGVLGRFETEGPSVVVPAEVRAGETFAVTIYTAWPNGCAHKDGTRVDAGRSTATLTPYDIVTRNATCTDAPRQFVHTAELRFTEPGPARVLVRARTSRDGAVQTIAHDVTVR